MCESVHSNIQWQTSEDDRDHELKQIRRSTAANTQPVKIAYLSLHNFYLKSINRQKHQSRC